MRAKNRKNRINIKLALLIFKYLNIKNIARKASKEEFADNSFANKDFFIRPCCFGAYTRERRSMSLKVSELA